MAEHIENHEDLMTVTGANFAAANRARLIAMCLSMLKAPLADNLDQKSDSEMAHLLFLAQGELMLMDDHGIEFSDHSFNRDTFYLDLDFVDAKALGNIGDGHIHFERSDD